MTKLNTDFWLGLLLAIFFGSVSYFLIPIGITNPVAHDPGAILPRTYPQIVMICCTLLALSISLKSLYLSLRHTNAAETTACGIFSKACLSALGFGVLLAFYFYIEEIGMIIGGFIIYAFFSILSGERNFIRLIIIDSILMSLLYLFFVSIMNAPIPLGPLNEIL